MRDLFVASVVFGLLPFVLKRPFWGILLAAWLGYMNPHLLCYGFAKTMPFVMLTVLATLVGMLLSKEVKRMVWSREVVVLLIFIAWMGVTTTQALYPDLAQPQFIKVIKIQVIVFMTLLLLTSRERVHLFIWVIVLSLGFYGVKGGIFTLMTGGAHRVQGPYGSFLGGNNEMALALVMTVPLMRYLQLQAQRRLVRHGLAISMVLTVVAIVGTQSRGALVALALTGAIFWVKSRHKMVTAIVMAVALAGTISFMPQEWADRMGTIQTYEQDRSAQGRITAWWTAYNLAKNRFTGGGFETFQARVFVLYSPEHTPDSRDVHSIYFEVLGEHGFVGLSLFLLLLGMAWAKCGSIIRFAKKKPDLIWARDLAAMIQVSFVGYMSAGAFLGLAYFDYIYHLVIVVVAMHHILTRQKADNLPRVAPGLSPPRPQASLAVPGS
jgi:putative inorganic carbon (hco3(-)) transporter